MSSPGEIIDWNPESEFFVADESILLTRYPQKMNQSTVGPVFPRSFHAILRRSYMVTLPVADSTSRSGVLDSTVDVCMDAE